MPQPKQVPSGVTGTAEDRQKAAEKTLSESAYLAHQANDAAAAIGAALDDLKKGLAQGVNPVGWAKQYPWVAVGAGAVAGFVATSLLVPSKEEQALAKLAKIERALNPPPPPPPHAQPAANGETSYKSGQSSLVRAVLGEVVSAIKPAVISLLTAGTTAAAAKNSPEEMAAASAGQQSPAASGDSAG